MAKHCEQSENPHNGQTVHKVEIPTMAKHSAQSGNPYNGQTQCTKWKEKLSTSLANKTPFTDQAQKIHIYWNSESAHSTG